MKKHYRIILLVLLLLFNLSLRAQEEIAPFEIKLNKCELTDVLGTDYPLSIWTPEYVTVVMKPSYYSVDPEWISDHFNPEMSFFWKIELYDNKGELLLEDGFICPRDLFQVDDDYYLTAGVHSYSLCANLKNPRYFYIFKLGDETAEKEYLIETDDTSWIDYYVNWAFFTSFCRVVYFQSERYSENNVDKSKVNLAKTEIEKYTQLVNELLKHYPNGVSDQRDKKLPTLNQLVRRMDANFGISNYFDPVTKEELAGKTPTARSSRTTNNSSSSSNSASATRSQQSTTMNRGVNSNTSTNYQPSISAEKKMTLRFSETNVKDCNIVELARHPLGNAHINPITLTKREFKSILKDEYSNLNVKEDKYDDFGFWDNQVPSYLAFRGKRVRSCTVDFIDKDLSGFRYYFTFDCNDYSEEDVMAFTEIICDELKLAGATLETKKLGENYVLDYGGKLDGHSINVSMTKYKNYDNYGVHLSTYPTRSYYASTSTSSSSTNTSSYKGKYSRWPYYYSNPICGFRLGYVQRSLRVTGGDLDEPVHIDMFGEENEVIPGFQLGFLFDPSDWLNMGMFGLNMGVNFEMFFNKWDAAPSNHYDKYMEMNLNFPLDLTFHIPFSSESALYLHGGLAIDWGIYNRLTYSRNSNIEPLTDVFCKHWIDNLNLSYEYGVDLRMKAVMLSLNYQRGFMEHPVFERYTTTIDKLSLGLSFVF